MAVSVASYDSEVIAGGVGSGSLTVTSPTGISEGDLLILIIGKFNGYNTANLSVPSGFTQSVVYQRASGNTLSISLYYKIAVTADESATDYTVTDSDTAMVGIAMLRITGWSTGDPIFQETGAGSASFSETLETKTESVTWQKPAGAIVIIAASSYGSDTAFSNPSITHGVANPTWTEVVEYTSFVDDEPSFYVTYAETTDTSNITEVEFDVEAGISSANAAYLMAEIATPNNATGTFTHLSTSPTFPDPVSTSGVVGTHSSLSVTPTLNKPTASGRSKTWTTTNKS